MSEDKKKKKHVHEELEGFSLKVNELGQIVSNYDIDKLNEFLNENVEDKKLKEREETLDDESE